MTLNNNLRPVAPALIQTAVDYQRSELLAELGDAFARATSAATLAVAVTQILADRLHLGFSELRVPSPNYGVDLVLARSGTPNGTLMDIELTFRGRTIATLTVPAGAPGLERLRGWLSLALGSLLELDIARGEVLASQQNRDEAAQTLNAVIQLHSDAVYLLRGHSAEALNAAALDAHREPRLAGAAPVVGVQTTSELLPVPSGALLFHGHREPSPVERASDFARRWQLSKRQQATVEALVEGKANKEIAATLDLSLVTVEGHLTAVFRRTGTRTRSELVAAVLLGESSREVSSEQARS